MGLLKTRVASPFTAQVYVVPHRKMREGLGRVL